MTEELPEGCHKELPRRGPDDPMRRFIVDCPACQGIGDRCCRGRGTVVVEVDGDTEIDA